MSESDPKLLNLESAIAETRCLREENARLQRLLQEHGIQIPGFPFTDGIPVATSEPSGARTPILKAEQRIKLFRDLFHGRDDVYGLLLLLRAPLPSSPRTGSSWPGTFQFRSRDEQTRNVTRRKHHLTNM
jgi:hypothetical protein